MKALLALAATTVIALVIFESIEERRAVRQFWIDRAKERRHG